jgi:hypothetical protein
MPRLLNTNLANSAFQFASSSNLRRSTWPKANKEAIGRPRNPKRRRSKSLPQHQAKRVRDGSRPSLTPKGNRNGWRHLTRCREIHRSASVQRLHEGCRQLDWPPHVIDAPPRILSRVQSSAGMTRSSRKRSGNYKLRAVDLDVMERRRSNGPHTWSISRLRVRQDGYAVFDG